MRGVTDFRISPLLSVRDKAEWLGMHWLTPCVWNPRWAIWEKGLNVEMHRSLSWGFAHPVIYSDEVTWPPTGCGTGISTAVWENQKLRVQKVLNQKGLVSQLLVISEACTIFTNSWSLCPCWHLPLSGWTPSAGRQFRLYPSIWSSFEVYRDEGFFIFLKSWTGHAIVFNILTFTYMSDMDRASPSRSSQLWPPCLSLHSHPLVLTFYWISFKWQRETFFPTICWVSTFNGLFWPIHTNPFTGRDTEGLPWVFYLSYCLLLH